MFSIIENVSSIQYMYNVHPSGGIRIWNDLFGFDSKNTTK